MGVTVLFVYPYPFNPMKGGVESVTDCLASELQKRGYSVKYLNIVKPENDSYDYFVPVYYFPSTDIRLRMNYDFYSDFLETEKIDIVINQDACFLDSILYLSRPRNNKKIKYISVFHGTPILNYKYFTKEHLSLQKITVKELCKFLYRCFVVKKRRKDILKERRYIFDFICKNSDAVCLLSDQFKREIVKYLTPSIPSNLVFIPNPCRIKTNVDFSKKENIILFVGRLDANKRVDRIIDAWNRIYTKYPDWFLYIVGDGPCRSGLEMRALRNTQVVFTGFQNPLRYYLKAKIVCLTSNHEGWGMVLTEAMQCGVVPIVFNSFASVTDIINDGYNGVLVKPFSIRMYRKELKKLMDNPDILHRMAENARFDSQKYSVESVVDQWETLFGKLLNG